MEKIKTDVKEDTFTKEQIVNSKMFKGNKDALNVILDEKKQYTINQVKIELVNFMKGKVN